ncbi:MULTISPECIES: hypothetical protein [Natrialbaceae]|uniref:hypothetical protein n=1 Tax=Natrialbaceae TaxID=1644061 RepID=UPI00207C5AEF|nr:hypothetical protein [Natronococcus sp. CG52]
MLAIGMAGLAGCTSSLPGMSDDGAGNDEIGSWLAEPGLAEILDDDRLTEAYGDVDVVDAELRDREFDYTDVQAVFDHEEELVVYWPLEDATGVRDRTGIPAIDLEWQLSQRVDWEFSAESETASARVRINVLAGSFDPDEIETALESWAEDQFENETEDDEEDEDGLSREGERDGYELYEAGEYGFAVGSDRVIEVQTESIIETTAALEAVLNGRETGTDRWTDDEEVQELLDRAGVGHLSEGELHEPHNRETLIAEQIERQFGVETADADELLAHRIEQRLGIATTDVDELVDHQLREWYGVDDPDEVPEEERERLRDDIEQDVASFEEEVNRELESVEDSIDIEDWEDGLVGSIRSLEIEDETTELTEAFLYESASAADADALREQVDTNRDLDDRWATLSEYEVDASNRILVVSGSVRTRSLLF